MTRQADFKRRVRARMAKTGESYVTARTQLAPTRAEAADAWMRRALHVTNGDSAAGTLLQTELVERVLPWRDSLHEGPVPDVPEKALRAIRAEFLGDGVPADVAAIERWLEERDGTLAENAGGEFVLWFEADLYDQLQLVQALARMGELGVDPSRITLICIGEHLGIAHFAGLGELDAEQLTRVAGAAATPVGGGALDLAREAWRAFRADDPAGLPAIARTHHPELRFLAEAFDRLSREYPSTRDGLSLTERRILAAVEDGATSAGAVFRSLGAREARPFLGDRFCFAIVTRLASARIPLLTVATQPVTAATKTRLTDAGRRVLDGADDHVRLNGVDRWIGGVHLAGDAVRWRWNEGTEAIVSL